MAATTDIFTEEASLQSALRLQSVDFFRLANWIRGNETFGTTTLNVRDKPYSAQGDDSTNDTTAIQAAVDAAADLATSGRRVVVYFPKGVYQTRSSIVIPRIGWPSTGSISFLGDGVNNTQFADSGYLPVGSPMWTFDATPDTATAYMSFSDMSWSRSGDGKIFEHLQLTDDEITERLIRCTFKNLHIRGKSSTTGVLTKELLHIQGGIECNFENVWGDGGQIWAHFEDCSHMYTHGFGTTTDTYSKNGFLVSGGGNHIFEGVRIEGTDGGYGIKHDIGRDLVGPVNVVYVGGPTYEGKRTTPMLDLTAGNGTTIINPAMGSTENSVIGIKMRVGASNVRLIGGRFSQFTGTSSYAIQVDASAKGFDATNLSFYGTLIETACNVSASAYRVSIEGYDGSVQSDYGAVKKGYMTNAFTTGQISNQSAEYDACTVALSGAANLDTILAGQVLQKYTLFFTNGDCTVRHLGGGTGNIKLSGSVSMTTAADANLTLQYDGSYWQEISRKVP